MKGLEMGHFGGGTGFKITGDQCHRVPDVEVEGIKKKISQPLKKLEVFGYLGKVYMKTETC